MSKTLTIRLDEESMERLSEVASSGKYRINRTDVVKHGIELAWVEMKELQARIAKVKA